MPLVCLASPKGGVGKTTLAANLACEMARNGARVVALDLDPQNALRLHFGVSLRDEAGLMSVLRDRGPWRSALRQTRCGVGLLPYGKTDMQVALTDLGMIASGPESIVQMLRGILADASTTLVVDTPPGPTVALQAVLPMTDFLVTVLLADAASVALVPSVEQGGAYGNAYDTGCHFTHGFVLNQVNRLSRLSRATSEAVGRHLGDRLLGTVARDENVAEAIACQLPVGTFSPASRAAQDIALLANAVTERMDSAHGLAAVAAQHAARRLNLTVLHT